MFTSLQTPPSIYASSPGAVDISPESFTFNFSSATVTSFNVDLNLGGVQNTSEQWTITSDGTINHNDSEGTFNSVSGVYTDNSRPHEFGGFTFTGATPRSP